MADQATRDHVQIARRWRQGYDATVNSPAEHPFHVSGVMGKYLLNQYGQPHLDFSSGDGTLPLSHGHSEVGKAVAALHNVTTVTAPFPEHVHGVQVEFLEWLVPHFPEGSRFMLFGSENEARQAAFRVASTMGFPCEYGSSPPGSRAVNYVWHPPGLEAHHTCSPNSPCPSMMIVTPIDPVTYDTIGPGLLSDILDSRKRHRFPLVWDDTVTGMGWLPEAVFTHHGDMTVLGGALGGGYPLGVVVAHSQWAQRALDLLGSGETAYARQAGMLTGCVAGLETLKQVSLQTTRDHVAALAEHIDGGIAQIQEQFPDQLVATGEGLLRGWRITGSPAEFLLACREKGLILSAHASQPVLRMAVPQTATLSDVDEMLSIVTDVLLDGTARKGARP